MSFAQSLRQDADPIFEAIYLHPFVQGIAKGQLPPESLIHYVSQDTEYLNTYSKVYGMALSKAQTPDQMRLFYNRIGILLEGELIPHLNLCRVAGVTHDEVMQHPVELAPTAHHYARHMLCVAQQGTLGEIVAVVLPCQWVYVDTARRIIEEFQPTTEHPFYDWISFYASDEMHQGLMELTALLDHLAPGARELDLAMMRSAFLDSSRLEYQFFDMAFTLQKWTPSGPGAYPLGEKPDSDSFDSLSVRVNTCV
ncbi:thiaminase II [Alicyclobacillus ferrooxydans]|uniref:Aminopyrimidine aminohydrolase n=1 Tax=Alicyclobacillus ferrooxydans TaxID=471514 RepID=A0A0P9GL63_9BACL|nr:thiaminase II [Alicyclobacillus ferrooxydans]KPV40872.1 hypothetical protein AN477_21555 [Alicyclobacillus ferrooxydans]